MTLIHAGRVRLNDGVCRDAERPVRLDRDRIQVEDEPLTAAPKVYLALNKPRGVVTTASDEQDRRTVYDFLAPGMPWVSPVGRLDKASEGLLLMTNDSEWAARVLAPETHLEKTYHVQIAKIASADLPAALMSGVRTVERELLRAKAARILRRGEKNTWLTVVLDEGKNRQIRRMFEAEGIEVLRLVRVAIGPLELGNLAKGAWRPVSEAEKLALDAAMQRSSQKSIRE